MQMEKVWHSELLEVAVEVVVAAVAGGEVEMVEGMYFSSNSLN